MNIGFVLGIIVFMVATIIGQHSLIKRVTRLEDILCEKSQE